MWVNIVGIFGIFNLAVALATKYLGLETDSKMWVNIPLGIAIAAGLLWIVVNARHVVSFATSPHSRHSVNLFVHSLIVLFIVVMVNVVVTSKRAQWDTTQNRRFSLADQSRRVVENLDEDVTVTAVFPSNLGDRDQFTAAFESQMEMYRAASGRVNYRLVDSRRNPQEVQELPQPITLGSIYVTMGDRTERVETFSDFANIEEKITRAIIAVSRDEEKRIVFVTRQGESLFEAGRGLALLRQSLQGENYEVGTVDLTAEEVPEDCSVLFIADPTYQFQDRDLAALTDHINRGGQVAIALDIEPVLNDTADSNLVDYLKQFGCLVGRDVLIEQQTVLSLTQGLGSDYSTNFVATGRSTTSDITKDLREPVVLDLARSVTMTEPPPEGVDAEALIMCSENAWAEDDIPMLVRGRIGRSDSKITQSPPVAQVVTVEVSSHPAVFTPSGGERPEGLPATFTAISPELTAPSDAAVPAPSEPLEISPFEPILGPAIGDEPAPGGAADEGGREEIGVAPASLPASAVAGDEATAEAAAPAGPARLIVLGDTTMLSDRYMVPGSGGNRDFILNAVNFLAAETDLIAIRPRDNLMTGFELSVFQQRLLIVILIVLPQIVAMAGVIVAVSRRRLA